MKNKFILVIFLYTFLSISPLSYADGILLSWSPRDVQGITEQAFNAAKQLNSAEIEKKNLRVSSWPEAYLLMVSATQHKDDKAFLKSLVSQISDRAKSELKATSRLIIWERVASGEIIFEGKGYQVSDDLFTVAGRSNWILRNLTKKTFGYVRPGISEQALEKLKQKWTQWLNGEQVEEYQDEYVSTEKGLEEIRSPEALEALIVSLKSGDEKAKLTKDCLKRLYNIDKIPDDPGSPAALCNPDSYTHRYLAVITGIKDVHDYTWWKTWWDTNKSRLLWNREKGVFDVKGI